MDESLNKEKNEKLDEIIGEIKKVNQNLESSGNLANRLSFIMFIFVLVQFLFLIWQHIVLPLQQEYMCWKDIISVLILAAIIIWIFNKGAYKLYNKLFPNDKNNL